MEALMQPTGVLESSKATKNPLKDLLKYGQSMWLDYIRRDLFTTGKLKAMIEDDGLRGMTSNPAIFEKAIADSSLYDDILHSLATQKDLSATTKYEQIAIRDIRDAADQLRGVYEETNFRDGYVSLEVSPYLANKTQAPIVEDGAARECHDQDTGHSRGASRDPASDQRRHQHQCDVALCAGSLCESC
jgi:transaldolase / glucose-6-phosphate isomerase